MMTNLKLPGPSSVQSASLTGCRGGSAGASTAVAASALAVMGLHHSHREGEGCHRANIGVANQVRQSSLPRTRHYLASCSNVPAEMKCSSSRRGISCWLVEQTSSPVNGNEAVELGAGYGSFKLPADPALGPASARTVGLRCPAGRHVRQDLLLDANDCMVAELRPWVITEAFAILRGPA